MEQYGIRAVRPLSEKTMARIARGVMKFVIENPQPFLIQYHSEQTEDVRGQQIQKPLMTVDASNRYGLVTPYMIQSGYGERDGQAPRVLDIEKPLGTVVAQSNKFAMCSAFISKYYGGGNTNPASGADEPLPTVTAIDHNAVCAVAVTQFNNNSIGQEVTKPINTLTAKANHYAEVCAFLVKYYSGDGNGSSCSEPAPTITTKDRLGLVTVHSQDYQIVDIGLRMLTPRELFDAQGFPSDYIIDVDADGKAYPKSEQVARCGNAVCPPIPTALVRANLPELCNTEQSA